MKAGFFVLGIPNGMTYSFDMNIESLKKRTDYLAVAKTGKRAVATGLVIQKGPALSETVDLRVGLTVTKKVGNAVERNRVKRRLRTLIRDYLPEMAESGFDYVVIGRRSALDRPYDALVKDMAYVCRKLKSA